MTEIEDRLNTLQRSVEAAVRYHNEQQAGLMDYVDKTVNRELTAALKALRPEIEKPHKPKAPEQQVSNYVIHYTSLDALVSLLENTSRNRIATGPILKPTSLRLYDSANMNDPTEGTCLVQHIPGQYSWINNESQSHAYIASFIEENASETPTRDNLVFWRMYGHEGQGCSLRVHIPPARLERVLYRVSEAKSTVDLLTPVLSALDPLVQVSVDARRTLVESFWNSLGNIRYLYKSEAYAYEHEWRFIIRKSEVDAEYIHFETAGAPTSHIRHYCEPEELLMDDLSVMQMMISGSSVTIGPSVVNPDGLLESLAILRQKAGLEHRLQIISSEIGYRKS